MRVGPGLIAFTRIFRAFRSAVQVRAKDRTAALLALYAEKDGKPFFWIGEAPALTGGHVHVPFAADSREAVDAFYRAALAAGAKDNGPPGLRPHYHANYYGAFVLDLDGNNIETVCHALMPVAL